jgi:aldose 1-epimerase
MKTTDLAVNTKEQVVDIQDEAYQGLIDGKKVELFTLRNKQGMLAKITNYAGKLVQLLVPDKHGKLGDVVLGYDSLKQAMHGQVSMGCTIGRFANRIARGQFVLNGESYQLTINNGQNHLHGGTKGSRFVVFDAKQLDEQTLELTYYFKDGEEGYPGNCSLKTVYTLTNENELKIQYDAVTDSPTIVNFTNHTFWNLAGEGNDTILDHELTLNADTFTPIDDTLIPTGEIRSVKNTPFDFTQPQKIGQRIDEKDEQLQYGHGYDLNWVLNKKTGEELSLAARAYEPKSGRVLEIYTTEPGIQFYSGNGLTGKLPLDIGKHGKPYDFRSAFALETQHFPDSPNKPQFPSVRLNPGQWFSSTTIHKFFVQK